MTTINGIPVYRATLSSPRCGMYKISLVDAPAVERDFQAFAAAREAAMRYAVQDEEKHLVRGVVMRANFPIYRWDKGAGEYYILYDAATIRTMAEKYLVEGRQNAVNLQHEDGSDVDGVNLVQWFIKDSAAGIAPEGFDDIEDGSLFGEFHVTNEDVWADVKAGKYRGFSLEGIFGAEAVQEVVSTEKMAIINQSKNTTMQKIMEAVRERIARALEGVDEEFARTEDPAAQPEGEAGEAPQQFGSVATDKGVLRWEGDEPLAEGNTVRVVDEDGNESEPADGEYTTESAVITVADGKVTAIADKEAAQESEQDNAAEEAAAAEAEEEAAAGDTFAAMAQRMEASFEERTRRIYEAFAAAGLDIYVIEAADTYAVVAANHDKFYRYALTFGEDGAVTLGAYEEVFPAFVTAEEREVIEARDAQLSQQVEDLTAELAALKAQPAGAAAHEQFRSAFEGGAPAAGDARGNVSRILGAR